mmetsp:Transcript_557/g.829  ORF Transcript_557/g.829 Transcript_557/m.829 type:complete len:249 (-) Transcript_557:132-878(-)
MQQRGGDDEEVQSSKEGEEYVVGEIGLLYPEMRDLNKAMKRLSSLKTWGEVIVEGRLSMLSASSRGVPWVDYYFMLHTIHDPEDRAFLLYGPSRSDVLQSIMDRTLYGRGRKAVRCMHRITNITPVRESANLKIKNEAFEIQACPTSNSTEVRWITLKVITDVRASGNLMTNLSLFPADNSIRRLNGEPSPLNQGPEHKQEREKARDRWVEVLKNVQAHYASLAEHYYITPGGWNFHNKGTACTGLLF